MGYDKDAKSESNYSLSDVSCSPAIDMIHNLKIKSKHSCVKDITCTTKDIPIASPKAADRKSLTKISTFNPK